MTQQLGDEILERMEEAEQYLDDHNESPPSDIVAYNELRSCADLFRMSEEANLIVQPEFQRDFIWKGADQTRFIDSLVKQLPVPSMCFALDFKRNQWIVIDGLQRISTIVRFLSGEDWKLAALDDIDANLKGKSAASFKNAKTGEMKTIYARVQNQTLPVNVIRCDLTKRNHNEYVFTIFHRLNSGGLKLNNQEIRNCIYSGTLNSLLKKLDANPHWRRVNSMREGENYRFTKQEAILRFFAFNEEFSSYKGSISKFLNDYMFSNRSMSEEEAREKSSLFARVIAVVSDKVMPNDVPPRLPGTVLEAAMVGIAKNIDAAEALNAGDAQARFAELRAHQSLSPEYLAEGLSKPDRVSERLNAAAAIFSK